MPSSLVKLFAGSFVAQILLIGLTPIITRIYSPSDLGVLAIFLAIVGPIALIATGGYSYSIMHPTSERRALELVTFALFLVAIVSVLTALIVFITVSMNWMDDSSWQWLVWLPFAVALAGTNTILVAYALRQDRFGLIASNNVVRTAAQGLVQIIAGTIFPSPAALVGATTVASGVANFRLSRNYASGVKTHSLTLRGIFARAMEYRKFPIYTLPAGLFSQAHLYALPLSIGLIFGAPALGLFSLTQRVLMTPLTLLGSAVSDIYYTRAVKAKRSNYDYIALYRKVLISLASVSLPPFILLAVLAPWLFGFAFGSAWEQAGIYARIMIPWMWVQFVVSPVTNTAIIFRQHKVGLWIQIFLAAVALGIALVAWLLTWDFVSFLIVLSISEAFMYAALVFVYLKVIRTGDDGQ